ncbi:MULTISPECIES: GMP synthase subunit A [Metallosphaera]|uniref:GMP synthase subunit A n=1 Tax=Metallosphaera TaxID=41980 RepID=UPI001F05B194|nr:GMP synthase subunit A [Metallosphaera sedula]MCH1770257.1 GMP synthase subunit A [Metallosphaera sedula]MCP6727909.1 GMP synthase subunit A [Metallosphaera sedula]BBL47474.1 GMP synthase [glutamine-hydrolyzing] subunit A [Metallosphaera sedula]
MKIGLIYFGGQYNHLILKNVKYLGGNIETIDPSLPLEKVKEYDCLIFSGGPQSVKEELHRMGNSPLFVREVSVPKLGICLGHQLIAHVLGGVVDKASTPEFGLVRIKVEDHDTILSGVPSEFNAWESHNDEVKTPPPGFRVLASSETTRIQSMVNSDNSIFTVQFHPEVKHTEHGIQVLKNFLEVCKGR